MENKELSKEFFETLKDVVSRPEQLNEYIQAYISVQSEEFKAEYKTYNKEQSEDLARVIIKDLVKVRHVIYRFEAEIMDKLEMDRDKKFLDGKRKDVEEN